MGCATATQVYMWDVGKDGVEDAGLGGEHAQSIYCVAVNERGTVAAMGSVDKVIRLWDPRTKNSFGVRGALCSLTTWRPMLTHGVAPSAHSQRGAVLPLP